MVESARRLSSPDGHIQCTTLPWASRIVGFTKMSALGLRIVGQEWAVNRKFKGLLFENLGSIRWKSPIRAGGCGAATLFTDTSEATGGSQDFGGIDGVADFGVIDEH